MITAGKEKIKVSNEDFKKIGVYRWYFDGRYAYRFVDSKKVYMHRIIAGTPKGKDTDHQNGDRTDNRRSNLIVCDRVRNSLNRTKLNINNRSGISGVYFSRGRWRAQKTENGRTRYVGSFSTKKEASSAIMKADMHIHKKRRNSL